MNDPTLAPGADTLLDALCASAGLAERTHLAQQLRLLCQAQAVELEACQARLQSALSASEGVGTWDWNIRSDRFEVDGRFALMHQVDPSEAGRRPIDDYLQAVHPDDRGRVARQIRACLHGQDDFRQEYRLRGNAEAEGAEQWRWMLAHGRCLRDKHGRPARFMGAALDITERKQQEQRLRELNENLELRVAERTQALAELNQRLQDEMQAHARSEEALRHAQKMEAVGQLTGGIAHDFNNMLTGVIGSLDLLKRYLDAGRAAEVGRFVDAATGSAQRAAALTHRLLAFSRRQPLDRRRVEPNALILMLRELMLRTTGEQIHLELALQEDTWAVETDANQLENALLNLVINARDAMPGGGTLRISSRNLQMSEPRDNTPMERIRPGPYVMLSVSDNGMGMPESVRAKAFEPFFTTKPTGQGTGLGLSMIYGFAQQSGGHVILESNAGSGTTVNLLLPRHRDPASLDPSPAQEPRAPVAVGGESVLVVEDDPAVRLLILNLLDELGYQGHPAADADVAVPLLESNLRIDLLVTDVGLPGTNGRQLAEIARRLRPGIKVLFMTGYVGQDATTDEMQDAGMAIVSKPFTLDALARYLHGMLKG
ncbi:ATP-binding protein [Pseudomonas typographi]|uniref:histidine kinase n=1 Tax=Pseudomonas typographi TaxID=2715964 RepID=A0ABR7Z0C8_9PSED|nr:ATP-binding protein [Pseudomonas typographi]MBD1598946.1 response regulator [Pseudomonas typographi]